MSGVSVIDARVVVFQARLVVVGIGRHYSRRPSSNQRQCRPSKKFIQLKACKENRLVACLANILSSA